MRGLRPVFLAWLFVTTLTNAPYLRAAMDPPRGQAFIGFFFFTRNAYDDLSYVQQAESGAFLMRNKLLVDNHSPALINLEWWAVGRLSAVLGKRPLLAYRLFAVAASFFLLLGIDRWLTAAGLPESRRLPALLLVSTAGGLGGVVFMIGLRPFYSALDVSTGLFPLIELLSSPHFVAGTTLLLWSLWFFQRSDRARDVALAVGFGSVLGLVRTLDLVLLILIHTLATLVTEPVRAWPRRLLPLAGLLPVCAYSYWLFALNPSFAYYSAAGWFPDPSDFAWALAPALLIAVATTLWAPKAPAEERRVRSVLSVWVACCAAIACFRPTSFALQFLAGVGLPILAFAALGLSRLRPAATLATGVLLSGSALVSLQLVLGSHPLWHVPAERLRTGESFRKVCREGDLALTPADVGLYVSAFSSCTAYLSYEMAPDYQQRVAYVAHFYEGSPAERIAVLDRLCIKHFAVPGDAGETPTSFLGASSTFRRFDILGAPPLHVMSLYSRPLNACPMAPDRAPPSNRADARGRQVGSS